VTSVPPPARVPAPPASVPAPAARRRRRPIASSLSAGIVAAALVLALVGPQGDRRGAQVGALVAAGAVRLATDHDDTAILTAANLVPGRSASGTVGIANTGDAAGRVRLAQTSVTETPGAGGGLLSHALVVDLLDITGGTPQPVYSGTLAGLGQADAGMLAAGTSRTYRVVAALPDTGIPAGPLVGDNRLQGAALQVALEWQAETVVPVAPVATATPVATTTPVATATPIATPIPIVEPLDREARRKWAAAVLKLRVPWQRVLVTRGVRARATCKEPCRLTFTAAVQRAPRGARRGRTLQRRGVFSKRGTRRRLPAGRARSIKLHLSRKALVTLHREMRARGRAAVVLKVRVKSRRGAATVRRRIVIVTAPRGRRDARPG
jgi:hypothetical protein